jgi:hypothetical protein
MALPGARAIKFRNNMLSRGLMTALYEVQQIGIDFIFKGGGHAVRRAGINLQCGVSDNFR